MLARLVILYGSEILAILFACHRRNLAKHLQILLDITTFCPCLLFKTPNYLKIAKNENHIIKATLILIGKKMREIKDLSIRIITAILLLTFPINIFYVLFSKITLFSSLPFLYLLGYSFNVKGYVLFLEGQSLEFVSACVATSAYYLLTLLVLLTKDVKFKDRVSMMLSGYFLILLMNVIRIDVLLYFLVELGENWFESFHIIFWHFVSSIYVAAVWVFLTYKFKIKSVPVYSDFKFLLSKSIFGKKKVKKRKRRRR